MSPRTVTTVVFSTVTAPSSPDPSSTTTSSLSSNSIPSSSAISSTRSALVTMTSASSLLPSPTESHATDSKHPYPAGAGMAMVIIIAIVVGIIAILFLSCLGFLAWQGYHGKCKDCTRWKKQVEAMKNGMVNTSKVANSPGRCKGKHRASANCPAHADEERDIGLDQDDGDPFRDPNRDTIELDILDSYQPDSRPDSDCETVTRPPTAHVAADRTGAGPSDRPVRPWSLASQRDLPWWDEWDAKVQAKRKAKAEAEAAEAAEAASLQEAIEWGREAKPGAKLGIDLSRW